MAVTWDGTLIQCDEPGCDARETVPAALVDESDDRKHHWVVGRAWTTEGGRHLCPEHW